MIFSCTLNYMFSVWTVMVVLKEQNQPRYGLGQPFRSLSGEIEFLTARRMQLRARKTSIGMNDFTYFQSLRLYPGDIWGSCGEIERTNL